MSIDEHEASRSDMGVDEFVLGDVDEVACVNGANI
jgi:hypothetical protein